MILTVWPRFSVGICNDHNDIFDDTIALLIVRYYWKWNGLIRLKIPPPVQQNLCIVIARPPP